jgi:hypothetical protein
MGSSSSEVDATGTDHEFWEFLIQTDRQMCSLKINIPIMEPYSKSESSSRFTADMRTSNNKGIPNHSASSGKSSDHVVVVW